MSGGVFVEGLKELFDELGVVGTITLMLNERGVRIYTDSASQLFYDDGSGLKSWPGGTFEMNLKNLKVNRQWGNLTNLGWYQDSKGQLYKWNGDSWDGNVPSEPDLELEYLG